MKEHDEIKLPPVHYDELPEPDDPLPAMFNYGRRCIEPYAQRIEELESQLEAIGAGGVTQGQRLIEADRKHSGIAVEAMEAIMESEQVQSWKKDAELFQFLLKEAWFQRAFDRFDPDDNGIQRKFESECRRILRAAMEQQK